MFNIFFLPFVQTSAAASLCQKWVRSLTPGIYLVCGEGEFIVIDLLEIDEEGFI